MESTDFYTLDEIARLLCPYCTAPPLGQEYRSKENDLTTYSLNASLAALALACRHTNAIATHHLYHQPSTTRWGPLLRTLIARPDLGRQVRYLSTREWVPAGVCEQRVPPEVKAYWVQQFPGHPSNGGVVRLPGNSLAPLAALLCSALRELDATVDEREAVPGFNVLPETPVMLDTLRTMAVSCPADSEGLNLPRLEDIFSLAPNLERFVAVVSGDYRLVPLTRLEMHEMHDLFIDGRPRRGHSLVDLSHGARRLISWMRANVEGPERWDATVFLLPGQSGFRLDREDAVPFYDIADDPWRVRGLADRRDLCTFSLDARCLVPHVNPQMRTSFPPSLSGEPRVSDEVLVELLPSSVRELRIDLGSVGPAAEDLGRPLSRLVDVAPERFKSLKKVVVAGKGADILQPWSPRFERLDVEFRTPTGSCVVIHGYTGEKD